MMFCFSPVFLSFLVTKRFKLLTLKMPENILLEKNYCKPSTWMVRPFNQTVENSIDFGYLLNTTKKKCKAVLLLFHFLSFEYSLEWCTVPLLDCGGSGIFKFSFSFFCLFISGLLCFYKFYSCCLCVCAWKKHKSSADGNGSSGSLHMNIFICARVSVCVFTHRL